MEGLELVGAAGDHDHPGIGVELLQGLRHLRGGGTLQQRGGHGGRRPGPGLAERLRYRIHHLSVAIVHVAVSARLSHVYS